MSPRKDPRDRVREPIPGGGRRAGQGRAGQEGECVGSGEVILMGSSETGSRGGQGRVTGGC